MPETHGHSCYTSLGRCSHEDVNGLLMDIERVWPSCVIQAADKPFLPLWVTNRRDGSIVIFRDEQTFCAWQLSERVEDRPLYFSWSEDTGIVIEGAGGNPVLQVLHEIKKRRQEAYEAREVQPPPKPKGIFGFLRRSS